MRRLIEQYLILALLTLMITACAVQVEPSPATPPASGPQTPSTMSPSETAAPAETPVASPAASEPAGTGPTPGTLPEPVQAAVEALGQQLGVDPGAIEVVEYQSVQWPDASLGCPQPGMMYAQVVTPGYRVVLKAGEQSFEYHTGQTGPGVLCSGDSLPSIPVTPGEIDDAVPWLPVD